MKTTATILLCVIVHLSVAQSQLEVGLKSSKTLYPSSLVKKDPLLKGPFLLVDDSIQTKMREVDYYRTYDDYFIIRSVGLLSNQEMRRVEEGEISVYTFLTTNHAVPTAGPNGMMTMGTTTTTRHYYFQKGRYPLQNMNMANLLVALEGNQMALKQMGQVKKIRNIRIGLWVAGGILTIAGLSKMINESNEGGPPYDSPRPNAMLVTGLITATIPFLLRSNKQQQMLKAVQIYNQ